MAYIKKQTIRIELKSDPTYWVELSTRVGWAAQKVFNQIPDGELTERSHQVLVHQIVDWNIDDESGTKLPVSEENINLLDRDDVAVLLGAWGEAKTEVEAAEGAEKKGSSNEQSQPSTPKPATK